MEYERQRKLLQEQREKEEIAELTLKPKINTNYKKSASVYASEAYHTITTNKVVKGHSCELQEEDTSELFKPKINKVSELIVVDFYLVFP